MHRLHCPRRSRHHYAPLPFEIASLFPYCMYITTWIFACLRQRFPFGFASDSLRVSPLRPRDPSALSHITLRSPLSVPCTRGLSFNGCEVRHTTARGKFVRVLKPRASAALLYPFHHHSITTAHSFDSFSFVFAPLASVCLPLDSMFSDGHAQKSGATNQLFVWLLLSSYVIT